MVVSQDKTASLPTARQDAEEEFESQAENSEVDAGASWDPGQGGGESRKLAVASLHFQFAFL